MEIMKEVLSKTLGIPVPDESESKTPITKEDRRVIGKIIKVSEDEGWGFISSKEIKFTRIFFHWTSLRQDTLKFQELKNGMKVEFTPIQLEGKGWRAIKICVQTDVVPSVKEKDEPTTAS